ncbi:hypothetical protein ACIGO9_30640 [Nocardia asteroides]|uniref:hypothetical protein n=1 Tax=Nocardia asteroides TaxID=1824 RepID=UPI0037C7C6DA
MRRIAISTEPVQAHNTIDEALLSLRILAHRRVTEDDPYPFDTDDIALTDQILTTVRTRLPAEEAMRWEMVLAAVLDNEDVRVPLPIDRPPGFVSDRANGASSIRPHQIVGDKTYFDRWLAHRARIYPAIVGIEDLVARAIDAMPSTMLTTDAVPPPAAPDLTTSPTTLGLG